MLNRSIRTVLAASCAALALSACRDGGDEASAAVGYGVAPSALAYDPALAPEAEALPATGPAPIGRLVSHDDGYAWAERAYAMDRAFYEVPPDYGFYYEEVQPWAWESQDDWTLYAEPISDGYRYYYYEPGAEYPYFVRDDEYGYGYDDAGRLVTLYTVAGLLLPASYLDDRAGVAGRYWDRAHDLRRAAARERRARIDRQMWLARQPVFHRSREPWMQAAVRRDDWRSYRIRHEQRDVRRFETERRRREAAVDRLNREELRRAGRAWRERGEVRQVAAAAPQHQDRRAWSSRRDDERRGEERRRAERQAAEAQQQARLEGERRDRAQAERRQRMERAQNERRGRQEAERRGREQQARADHERRGREQAQAERRQQMEQARSQNERRGREQAERRAERRQAQPARQEARNAHQAARDAGGRERGDRGQGRGRREH